MQYLAAVLAFVAVLVAIRGHPWDQRKSKLTRVGWATITVAFVSLCVSIFTAYRDQKNLDWQASQHAKVRLVAQTDLRNGLNSLTQPFRILWSNAEHKNEKLEFDSERFIRDPDYFLTKLREPAFRDSWSQFDLRKSPESPIVRPNLTWGEFFSKAATTTNSKLDTTVAKYGAYLESEQMLQVHAIQSDPFFDRLMSVPTIIELTQSLERISNAVGADSSYDFTVAKAFQDPDKDELTQYLQFVERVEALARSLPPGAKQ